MSENQQEVSRGKEQCLLSGPLVFINVYTSRSDALIATPDGVITSVSLPELSTDRAGKLLLLWTTQLHQFMGRERGVVDAERMRGYLNPFTTVLEQLWSLVVSPILLAMDLTSFVSSSNIHGSPMIDVLA